MKFKIKDLVETVMSRTDEALILSPKCIIREYGEQLLTSLLPGGKTTEQHVESVKANFREQLDLFMNEHNDASLWVSKTIASTVKKLVKRLLK